jgi:hypothetical protein
MSHRNNREQEDRGHRWFERAVTEKERQDKSQGAAKEDNEQRP